MEKAASSAPVFDEDSPVMNAETLAEFKRVGRENRNKKTVAIRLSPATLNFAKSYGKGYTSFLSRLLDEAIKDEAMVRRCT